MDDKLVEKVAARAMEKIAMVKIAESLATTVRNHFSTQPAVAARVKCPSATEVSSYIQQRKITLSTGPGSRQLMDKIAEDLINNVKKNGRLLLD